MIAETSRLTLRELTVDDAPFVLELVTDPSFVANIGDKGVHDLEAARRFILEGQWTALQPPGHGQFLVECKITGMAVGVCGVLYRERLGVSDVGCAFLPRFRGRGLALEALRAVLEYARTTLGLDEVVALTAPHNQASLRIVEKLGMTYRRTVRMNDDDPGTLLYA